jgi:hypothetical protein
MTKNGGWHREPARHGLAAKGVKTRTQKKVSLAPMSKRAAWNKRMSERFKVASAHWERLRPKARGLAIQITSLPAGTQREKLELEFEKFMRPLANEIDSMWDTVDVEVRVESEEAIEWMEKINNLHKEITETTRQQFWVLIYE